ncbi:hypothetical protein CEXT_365821 [Caerostris extrusa]|uniref:Uncharacterized protein n=1 Tax=Caerostris extrusa TaxID=172846 RepID=A0AAV4VBH5_CAEEX|nr:hypothetical protein CEXT_365821 [Caerostris extrusa]
MSHYLPSSKFHQNFGQFDNYPEAMPENELYYSHKSMGYQKGTTHPIVLHEFAPVYGLGFQSIDCKTNAMLPNFQKPISFQTLYRINDIIIQIQERDIRP